MILFWIFSCIGITHIITGTKIFENFREFANKISPNFFGVLFECPTCTGFWVGIFVSLFFPLFQISEFNSYFEIFNSLFIKIFFAIFLHGCISSFFNWITNVVITYIDVITTETELKNEIIISNPLDIAKQILNENKN